MPTPAELLAALVEDDPTRPALTFYDDTPGPAHGERIEISRKVLGTWVAKAANALQEGFDCEPGSVVWLDIPTPHWRMAYWALAVWSVGATVTLDAAEGADVLVTTNPDAAGADDADEIIAVSLPALARAFDGELRSGVMDEAREISSYGDSFEPWDEPQAQDAALVSQGQRTTYESISQWGLAQVRSVASRTLLTTTDPVEFLRALLRCWAGLGSVVLVRGGPARADDERMRSEGVDAEQP